MNLKLDSSLQICDYIDDDLREWIFPKRERTDFHFPLRIINHLFYHH